MMITLPYLGPVHTTYDFNQTLNAHNSKWPNFPLCVVFWIDLGMNKYLLWWKLLTITIISVVQKDFDKFWRFWFFRMGQNPKFPKKKFFFYETYFKKLSIARKILLNNWNYMSLEGCLKLRSRWYPYGPQKTTHSGANLFNFGHFWPFERTTLEICLL